MRLEQIVNKNEVKNVSKKKPIVPDIVKLARNSLVPLKITSVNAHGNVEKI